MVSSCTGDIGLGKKFFTERIIKYYKKLLKKLVMAPDPSVFKKHLDNALR